MKIAILIPHYRTGKMTAYAIAQFLKYKGDHELQILISDNNAGDGSVKYLEPFKDQITILPYPKGIIQSHGIGLDRLVPLVDAPLFITAESDSFPTKEGWLDYYVNLFEEGYDMGGSLLQLSGGQYIHPAGAFYTPSLWYQAKAYCEQINYAYFSNMAMKEDFACHLMVRKDFLNEFLGNPEPHIILSDGMKPYSQGKAMDNRVYYKPVVGPFHNGMGRLQESVKTYGMRNMSQDSENVLLDNSANLIYRIGYEPGQWLAYWAMATDKQIFSIPTEVKWLPNRENQQQEYTRMENGFHHCWGVSAYHEFSPADAMDVAKVKQELPEMLYSTLPDELKIND